MALPFAVLMQGGFAPRKGSIARRSGGRNDSDNPRLSGKAPISIKSMKVINRSVLHVGRILAFAQCRRDARHHDRRNAADMAFSGTMDMAAENGDDLSG